MEFCLFFVNATELNRIYSHSAAKSHNTHDRKVCAYENVESQ